VPAGPVRVDVTVLRRGRTMSQATATVAPRGRVGHTSVAVFGADRLAEFTDLAMPDVSPPGECPSFRDPPPPEHADEYGEGPPFAFWEHVEGRPAIGHAPWEDYVPTSSECAYWYRFEDPPVRPDGTLDPLAVITLCDLMPSSVGQRMGPGTRVVPAQCGPDRAPAGETRSGWLLAPARPARHRGYASVETALWGPSDRTWWRTPPRSCSCLRRAAGRPPAAPADQRPDPLAGPCPVADWSAMAG
jgi:hypothetical protein